MEEMLRKNDGQEKLECENCCSTIKTGEECLTSLMPEA